MTRNQLVKLGIWVLIFGLTLCGLGLFLLLKPVRYEATTRIKVEINCLIEGQYGFVSDTYSIQTLFEMIGSDLILGKVETNLDLNEVWGRKYAGGKVLETAKTIKILRQGLSLKQVRNTKLVDVGFTDDDPEEAAKIANAIAGAYKQYRVEAAQEQSRVEIKVLQEQSEEQEKQIRVMKTSLGELKKKAGIPDLPQPGSRSDPDKEYIQMKIQLTDLQKYNKEELRDILPMVWPDEILSSLLDELHDSQQNQMEPVNDVTTNNASKIAERRLNDLNEQIDARVAYVLNEIADQVAEKREKIEATKAYIERERNLDHLLEWHRLQYLKIDAEKIDATIPKGSLVQFIEHAMPPQSPLPRDFALGVSLFVVGLFPTVAGVLLLRTSSREFRQN